MKMIVGALMLVSSTAMAQTVDPVESAADGYETCIVEKTVALGRGSSEPLNNVFEAATEACRAGRGRIYAMMAVHHPNENAGRSTDALARMAEVSARRTAMLRLLEARSSN